MYQISSLANFSLFSMLMSFSQNVLSIFVFTGLLDLLLSYFQYHLPFPKKLISVLYSPTMGLKVTLDSHCIP